MAAALIVTASVSAGADVPVGALDAVRVKNFDIAASVLNEQAARGDLDAMYHLAGLYRRGLGVPKDSRKADELYRQLVSAGYQRALAETDGRQDEYWWLSRGEINVAQALHWSAQLGLLPIVEDLLRVGAPIDTKLTFGRTALIEAVEANQPAIVQRLLEAGADPNRADDWGDSALILALKQGNEDVAIVLLANGADPNQSGSGGNTPLIVTAQRNLVVAVAALIESGASVDASNEAGQSALGIAEVREHKSLASLLRQTGATSKGFEPRRISSLSGLQLNAGTSNGRSVWFIAAERGLADALSTLIAGGANPDQRDSSGKTALMLAAERGEQTAIEALLASGANPALKNDDATALELAVKSGHATAARTLFGRAPEGRGNTARLLRLAVLSESTETLSTVLSAGVTDEAEPGTGRTAVMLAASQKHNAMLEGLLDAGSNIDEFDVNGRNAGWYAADAGSVQNIALLGNAGADLKFADKFGDTPLHRAATRGYAGTVRALSGVGALTDDQNEKGLSAIMLAAIYG